MKGAEPEGLDLKGGKGLRRRTFEFEQGWNLADEKNFHRSLVVSIGASLTNERRCRE